MDGMEITTRWVPMYDTGIGREAGYEDDKALIAAAKAERAALPEPVRRALEEHDRDMERRFLFGG
jgi:hypothetical protein